jgi:aminoglycoside phosphotransferase (APT) family kinase protein
MKKEKPEKHQITAEFAGEVLRHYFEARPEFIEQIHGGLANYVFEARLKKRELIVRLSDDPCRLPTYMKEQWAVKRAKEHGVPVAEILEVGNAVDGVPYMISQKVVGLPANESADRLPILRELARYARIINSITTSSFGHTFNWSRNKLKRYATWVEFLDNELKVQERLELFRKKKVLSPEHLEDLEAAVKELKRLKSKPTLNHGDLRLKNVLLNEQGRIKAIIDWENCTSNVAPFWDFSIALHDLSIDEKQAFLEGYGMSAPEFVKIAPIVKTLNVLNYFRTVVETGAEKNGESEFLKARLNGAFDLYSL